MAKTYSAGLSNLAQSNKRSSFRNFVKSFYEAFRLETPFLRTQFPLNIFVFDVLCIKMVWCNLTTCFLARNTLFLFLYLHICVMEAAVPIDIQKEENTTDKKLIPKFPYILSIIPGKEPLIARKLSAIIQEKTDQNNTRNESNMTKAWNQESNQTNSNLKTKEKSQNKFITNDLQDYTRKTLIEQDSLQVTIKRSSTAQQNSQVKKELEALGIIDDVKDKITLRERLFSQRLNTSLIPRTTLLHPPPG